MTALKCDRCGMLCDRSGKLYEAYYFTKNKSEVYVICRAVENLIKNAPTADVQEAKHGKWIKHKSTHIQDVGYMECSSCNEFITILGFAFPYCPNCGAKMDGKENDE